MLLLYKDFKGLGNLHLMVHRPLLWWGLKTAHQQVERRRHLSLKQLLKHLSPMLVFSMTKLEIIVDIDQGLVEAALIGPVEDMFYIQEALYLLCKIINLLYSI